MKKQKKLLKERKYHRRRARTLMKEIRYHMKRCLKQDLATEESTHKAIQQVLCVDEDIADLDNELMALEKLFDEAQSG